MLALVVTRDGFPLAHVTLAGNTQDVETVQPAAPARVDSLLTQRAAQDHNDQLPVAST